MGKQGFINDWQVSDVQKISLKEVKIPVSIDIKWEKISAYTESDIKKGIAPLSALGFVDAGRITRGKDGVVFFKTEVELSTAEKIRVFLGYDGPVAVWFNDRKIFSGFGTNPAVADLISIVVKPQQGINKISVALDTNNGKAEGIFCRIVREEKL